MTEGLSHRHFTVAEVEAMVAAGAMEGDERIELIHGELVPMSPKGHRHERVKVALNRHWCRVAPDDVEVAQETTFRLSADTYLEPDFVLFDRTAGLTSLSGDNVYLVVEISDTSLRYDIGRKAALYASFGVRELWVLDAVKLKTRVFRDPSPEGFLTTWDVTSKGAATPRLAPPAFALRLADLPIERAHR